MVRPKRFWRFELLIKSFILRAPSFAVRNPDSQNMHIIGNWAPWLNVNLGFGPKRRLDAETAGWSDDHTLIRPQSLAFLHLLSSAV